MKILLAPDSYKGSLNALEVANNIKYGIDKVIDDADYRFVPMADGGEGTVDVMLQSLKGSCHKTIAYDPFMRKVQVKIGISNNNEAIIEIAQACGLPLIENELDIINATSYGVGQMILYALDCNCRKIYVGLGGSATNDAGVGMMQALGASFKKQDGSEIKIGASELHLIEEIDLSNLDKRLKDCEIISMCDVDNPLCGINGATYVYGAQKGASLKDQVFLDKSLRHVADISRDFGDFANTSGAGAAGGLGFALMCYLKAKKQSGIETILDVYDFDELLDWADLVITGEGRIDYQSVNGKVISGIINHAKKKSKPVVAIVGCIGERVEELYSCGINAVESCVDKPCLIDEAIENAAENARKASERLMRAIMIGRYL